MRRVIVALGVVVAIAVGDALPASAVTTQGTYSYWQAAPWRPPGGWAAIGQNILPVNDPKPKSGQVPQAYFYALADLTFKAGGGYFGLQTDTLGKRAIFSLWGGVNALCSNVPGAECHSFNENGGTGYSVAVPYSWVAGHTYFLRVRVSCCLYDGWDGDVQDLNTGVWTHVGAIIMPTNSGGLQPYDQDVSNFTEYYGGPPATCAQFPLADVRFYAPKFWAYGGSTTNEHSRLVRSVVAGTGCPARVLTPAPLVQEHITGS